MSRRTTSQQATTTQLFQRFVASLGMSLIMAACQANPPSEALPVASVATPHATPTTVPTPATSATLPVASVTPELTPTARPTEIVPTPTPREQPPIRLVTQAAPLPSPIVLEPGATLFIDDYLISARLNVTRTVNQPQRGPRRPVITGVRPQGKFNNVNFSSSVVYDEATNRFRMWYTGHDLKTAERYTAHVTSTDGIAWSKPREVPGTRNQTLMSVVDEGPDFEPSTARFKAFRVGEQRPFWVTTAMISADGLHWAELTGQPVFTERYGEVIRSFYDEADQRYGLLLRWNKAFSWVDKSGRQHQNTTYDPTFVRLMAYATSTDLDTVTEPQVIFAPDDQDVGETQFYNMSNVIRRGGYYLAMLSVLRDDVKAAGTPPEVYSEVFQSNLPVFGTGYTVLAWSRDGEQWQRDRETDPFFEPAPQPGTWDHAHAWIDSVVLRDDLFYFYYGGYQYGHKIYSDRQIGLARLERDRFVAQTAGSAPGVLRTVPVVGEIETLTLNADADEGSIRVQILDEHGLPLPGFTYADCASMRHDGFAVPVECAGDFATLAGQPIQLEFYVTNARLFGFSFNE